MQSNRKYSYHLEIRKNCQSYTGIIRSSYRVADQVQHKIHGRLSGMSLEALKLLQAAFRGKVVAQGSPEALRTQDSKEYGAPAMPYCGDPQHWIRQSDLFQSQ